MSYQNRGQQQQQPQGYGQYNPYDQDDQYGQAAGYGNNAPYSTRPEPDAHGGSYYGDEEQGNGRYEMNAVNSSRSRDADFILNECREVDRAINQIDKNLDKLKSLHQRSLDDTDASGTTPLNREIDRLNEDTMTLYRSLVQRIKTIKSNPESGNPRNSAQVGKVDRRLKTAINQYQQVDRDQRKKLKDQMARQYRIVRPEASDAEVEEAVGDTSNQMIFSDALINSDRRGQAQTVSNRVKSRHAEIQKIEQQMIELAQLFQDMEALVVQAEPQVARIEEQGEEVKTNVERGNQEIDTAIRSARAARRKKWMCFGIVVLILIIIAVAVGVGVGVSNHH